ncbi:MAG: prepilin-type N-terminal cleavage/methylation domain-containing protein [Phycisphaerales bacterium]
MLKRAFTLIEVLAVVATIATLTGLLLPSLASARHAARSAACSVSLGQLALAVQVYALDFKDAAPPGAAEFLKNLSRWHGSRAKASQAFSPAGGSMSAYLGQESGGNADGGGRVCPTFRPTLAALADRPSAATGGFERGCGGYGYNNTYLGVARRTFSDGSSVVASDRVGSPLSRFVRPAATIAFADSAFASSAAPGGLIEYSFVEPRFWPDNPAHRPDPSMHFRHTARANMAMLDGHVESQARTSTWSSGMYGTPAVGPATGWPGIADTNELFDYE